VIASKTISASILAEKVKEGDKEAFEELYNSYSKALYGIVCQIVRSEEAGQDVLQEVFVKIWKNIHTYNEEKGSLFTWMLNIARHSAIDALRKIKKEDYREIRLDSGGVSISHIHTTQFNVHHIGVKKLTEGLVAEQKEMVDYIYFNGYTQQEVSDKLGIPLGTVKTRTRSAVRALRKLFAE